jgi:hypothetical protein
MPRELARTLFNEAGPLAELGRLDEAARALAECQQVFEEEADIAMLAMVLGSRVGVEAKLEHWQLTADLGRAALRLAYVRPDPRQIAASHHGLASALGRLGGDRAGQRAHRLAAALIYRLTGMAHDLDNTMRVLADESRSDGGADGLPATLAQVISAAELTEGVQLGDLLAAWPSGGLAVEDAMTEILSSQGT